MLLLIILFVILCLCIIAEWMREIRTFQVTHYHITSKKLKKMKSPRKVILLSDLHSYCYGDKNEKLLAAIAKEQPELILVAGDMLVTKMAGISPVAEEFMMSLPDICDVYYANGNHEQKVKEDTERFGEEYESYKRKLEEAGIIYLENEKAELQWDGVPVEIIGLEIPLEKYAKLHREKYSLAEIEAQIGISRPSVYKMLIAHNPMFMKTYLEWGADLVVSGHLHGGVMRLPLLGGIITPQSSLFPKYSGEMTREGDASVVVSKGLGVHTIKVRLFNPAEVVVMHIDGTEE